MARVTEDDVLAIIDAEDGTDLDAFIADASALVTAQLESKGLEEPVLKAIERYLAAHFWAVSEQSDQDVQLGPLKVKPSENTGTGLSLETTKYGKQVILFDTSNTLVNIGKKRASLSVASSLAVED